MQTYWLENFWSYLIGVVHVKCYFMTQKYMREIVGGDLNGGYNDTECRGHFNDWVLQEIESATNNACQINEIIFF